MLRCFCLFTAILTSSLSAQTFYEPLEYEYRSGGTLYFYGGFDPRVHRAASELQSDGADWGRHNGFAFSSASVSTSREVETERVRVFTDRFRYGLQDATVVGFTVADARNQAFASVPRYFEKAQLLRDAQSMDGLRTVPARAGGITIRKSSGEVVTPSVRPLMIFPKPALPPRQEVATRTSVD